MFRFRPPQICSHCRQIIPRAAAGRCPLCHTPFHSPRSVRDAPRPVKHPGELKKEEHG